MERAQFTFYRSYYEAIRHLSKKDRETVLMAVCAYALDNVEPTLTGVAASVFTLIRPTLDSGRIKAENRISKRESTAEQNDNKPGTNQKQNGNKPKTNRNQNENKTEQTVNEREEEEEEEKEVEREGESERENDSSISYPPLSPHKGDEDAVRERGFCPELEEAVLSWLRYKRERREGYKPTGLAKLLTQIEHEARDYGVAAVVDVMGKSMSVNYQGIIWDWLRRPGAGMDKAPQRPEWRGFDE